MPRDASQQKTHFDSERNQYSLEALINPPLHTRLEEQRVVDAVAHLPQNAKVLDFGAGTGRISIAMAKAGRPVIAMDISEDSLAKLEAVAAQLKLNGISTTRTLPMAELDAIVGADVLHHVPLGEILPQLHVALKPGGMLVFSEPGGFHPFWYAYQTLRRAMWIERRTVTINRLWLPRQLEAAGFTDIELRGVGLLPRPIANIHPKLVRWNDDLATLPVLRWFAYRYLITARKPVG